MPALIYLIYSFAHVVIDTYKGLYNTAVIEIWIGIVFTLLLNVMCEQGLGIVSWLVISIPFILMTVIASMLLFMFRLNPTTGQAIDPATATTATSNTLTPSKYAFPISVFYGSLGNSTPPATTR
jgi:ATP/ADP translocase